MKLIVENNYDGTYNIISYTRNLKGESQKHIHFKHLYFNEAMELAEVINNYYNEKNI